jgi:hypothetical protein
LNSAEACYINTGHPDFLSGHRAMAIVSDRINPKTNATPPADRNTGPNAAQQKPMTPQQQSLSASLPVRDANADIIAQQNEGFFGSFFKGQSLGKKRPGVLEAVPYFSLFFSLQQY